jgi:phosphoribosylanthranilate isomerase
MKIKVCGMKYPENIKDVLKYTPDFMGFIFYEKSPRFVEGQLNPFLIHSNYKVKTVGVFVNTPLKEVLETVKKHQLNFVQLHGNESIEYVIELSNSKIKIIKAFQINDEFDWESIREYSDYVNYFLFDTVTKSYGGSGQKFNWNQLEEYKGSTPFFLSGGISLNDIEEIQRLRIHQLHGIDVNSKFENEPGIKNVELVKEMIKKVQDESSISG